MAEGVFLKKPHMRDCDGELINKTIHCGGPTPKWVHTDKTGRVGNGGMIGYEYRCNMEWAGCEARVIVWEKALRQLAVAAEVRP